MSLGVYRQELEFPSLIPILRLLVAPLSTAPLPLPLSTAPPPSHPSIPHSSFSTAAAAEPAWPSLLPVVRLPPLHLRRRKEQQRRRHGARRIEATHAGGGSALRWRRRTRAEGSSTFLTASGLSRSGGTLPPSAQLALSPSGSGGAAVMP
ncbi:hypothetical protein PVAP13_9KG255613 [Panicum virgatum]|uniref:Uncharacterized protein n=1 Tax=Panicum virgatum TaxID=38727 RepID=A0A8T0NS79_PANVG|nr:hypothetical protein PVAP13_9KG255613 [Panicum virgatum]